MPRVTCPDCGAELTDLAPACPGCARPIAAGNFSPQSPPGPEGATTAPRRWIRYFARMLDLFFAGILLGFLIGVVAPSFLLQEGSTFVVTWLGFLIWVPAEAVLMATWGMTPGKALLRIQVRQEDGESLPLPLALNRSLRVWFFGTGTGFPVAVLFTMAYAGDRVKRDGRTSWDRKLRLRVWHQPIGPARAVIAVLLFLGILLLNIR